MQHCLWRYWSYFHRLYLLQYFQLVSNRFPHLMLLNWSLILVSPQFRCFLGVLLKALGFMMPFNAAIIACIGGATIVDIAPFALIGTPTVQIIFVLHSFAWYPHTVLKSIYHCHQQNWDDLLLVSIPFIYSYNEYPISDKSLNSLSKLGCLT